jgi:hypothetical protein
METKRTGRKPKPAHLKVHMVAAYLTLEQKEMIINEFGSLTNAVKQHILSKLRPNGHSNSIREGQPMDGQ